MSNNLAYIHPNAKIGTNVTISPFVTIEDDVEIGDNTWIGPNVTIMSGSRIGQNCKIFPGAVIGAVPQDLKFKGEKTKAVVGDNTVIRECVTINRGTVDREETRVGSNCLLMAYVHLAHDCLVGDNCIIANAVQVAGHVEIDDFAIIGGASAVHQFAKIGAHVMVSGGSLVRKDIPPYVTAGREPISYCGVNSVGLRRRGFDNEKINQIQEIYRIIYQKGLNRSRSIDQIRLEIPASKERDYIINFISGSDRGIMKGYGI
ncbi:acyl-ACP--UDP-N-acetylglucosamine O-acyltransferase [Marinigracilibium pacificum]|uniref:Acyl-ACP--UDP-N-acetylglucosamine O-acyltransferase n=1 Tax=Marinigracilibium pacificum TaxID=2729599 RepID=A0A848J2P8_9BACT|nr:acyl-ACP--UDP-N-acetylglucosamine O-acyltransferase [Marinigracilibium pacificum]NMM48599.1 acyl-ACP--UDP-N-acetylglucosamine O-acyltransferase [Marinigracilibium pacificum]